MPRVIETINAELDEIVGKIADLDQKYDGKAIDNNEDAAEFKRLSGLLDTKYTDLAAETSREETARKAANRIKEINDKKAVNIKHGEGDPERQPGKGAIPDVFTKAFGGHGSVGDAFVNSQEFKSARESLGIKDGDRDTVRNLAMQMPPATVQNASYKALVYSATTSVGDILRPMRLPNILEILREPIRVTDLFPTIPVTGTNAVEYVVESSFTNNAAVVPEATSTTDDLALKPESALVLDLVEDTLELIAHLIPASRQILADAAQIRALIDSRLRIGLLEKLEANVVAAVYAATGLLVQAVGADTKLDALYRGLQKVRVTGKAMPESYIMHPNDWTDIRLAKDLNGQYLMGAPSVVGPVTVWGIPVVDTQNATEGTPLVGDWSMFGQLYEREQIQTYVSDSHKDWFQRNLIAILMEMRALLAVIRATAACEITGF